MNKEEIKNLRSQKEILKNFKTTQRVIKIIFLFFYFKINY